MRIGADAFLGEHDFSAFCRLPHGESGRSSRRVLSVDWSPAPGDDRLLVFEIEANAFCHQMVRSIVGTLVGGRAGTYPGRRAARDVRMAATGPVAASRPPREGLCLVSVGYPGSLVPGGTWQPGGGDWVAAAP